MENLRKIHGELSAGQGLDCEGGVEAIPRLPTVRVVSACVCALTLSVIFVCLLLRICLRDEREAAHTYTFKYTTVAIVAGACLNATILCENQTKTKMQTGSDDTIYYY